MQATISAPARAPDVCQVPAGAQHARVHLWGSEGSPKVTAASKRESRAGFGSGWRLIGAKFASALNMRVTSTAHGVQPYVWCAKAHLWGSEGSPKVTAASKRESRAGFGSGWLAVDWGKFCKCL